VKSLTPWVPKYGNYRLLVVFAWVPKYGNYRLLVVFAWVPKYGNYRPHMKVAEILADIESELRDFTANCVKSPCTQEML
jgi:hypothetical protein